MELFGLKPKGMKSIKEVMVKEVVVKEVAAREVVEEVVVEEVAVEEVVDEEVEAKDNQNAMFHLILQDMNKKKSKEKTTETVLSWLESNRLAIIELFGIQI